MIREIIGDLLTTDANYICHQVNCMGVMGAGVARQIRNKLITKEQYQSYQNTCYIQKELALGKNQVLEISKNPYRAVVNMFGENIPTGTGLDTDYKALYKCFKTLEADARKKGYTAAIPGYIGCGLAGGDWEIVKGQIIEPIFKDSPVKLTIVYWEKENTNV